jgi:argonaute-like protein implicated in RNA metabolism and viral defense
MAKLETNVIKPEIGFLENEIENIILSSEFETTLDSKISDIENYIKNNNGKGKSDEEKDELYKNAQELWKEYAISLRDTKYNFYLNRPQYNFITDLLLKNLEYDVNTVFFAIELTNLLASMKGIKYTDDKQLIAFPVNATEITYIYHLISPYKVKGLSKHAYLFAQVLRRIGDISKIFNYYDTTGKNMSNDVQNWATAFEDGVTLENNEESVEATVLNSNE